jgi:hypothetical protein
VGKQFGPYKLALSLLDFDCMEKYVQKWNKKTLFNHQTIQQEWLDIVKSNEISERVLSDLVAH